MEPFVRYVAIGDSLTEGAGSQERDFVDRFGELAEQRLGKPVRTQKFGQSGITSGDLRSRLESDPNIREAVREADLITVTIGGNDLLQAAQVYYTTQDETHLMKALKIYQHQLVRIVRLLFDLKDGREEPYGIRLISLYNPLFQFEEAIFWVNVFNRQLHRFSGPQLKVVEVYDVFAGRELELLSSDFIHPNDEGYRLMAEKADSVGYDPVE